MSNANSLIVGTSTFPFGGPMTNSLLQYYCDAAPYLVSTGSPGYPFARGGGYPPSTGVAQHFILDGDHDYAVPGVGPTADSVFVTIAYQGSNDTSCIGEFDKQTGLIKRIAVLPCSGGPKFIVDAEGGVIYPNDDFTTIARLPAHGPTQSLFIDLGATVEPLLLRLSPSGEIGVLILNLAFVPILLEIRRYDAAGNYLGLWITNAELAAVPPGPIDYYTSAYYGYYFDFVFGPGDSIYVIDGRYNRILIFEAQTGRFSQVLIPDEDLEGWSLAAMALSPDNEFLYLSTLKYGPSLSCSCAIQVFPATGGKQVAWLQLGAQFATGMTFITQDVAATRPIGSIYEQPEYPIWEILLLLRLAGDTAGARSLRTPASFSPAAMDKARRVWEGIDEKAREAMTAAGILALSRLLRDPALHTELRSLFERNFDSAGLDRLQALLNRRRPSQG